MLNKYEGYTYGVAQAKNMHKHSPQVTRSAGRESLALNWQIKEVQNL